MYDYFILLNLFIYLFIFGCVGSSFLCEGFLSSCGKRGPLFIAVRGPLIIAASLVAEHRLQRRRLSNCGSRAQLLRGVWDLPRPGHEPVSPALAGRFSTIAPPGKPQKRGFWWKGESRSSPNQICPHFAIFSVRSTHLIIPVIRGTLLLVSPEKLTCCERKDFVLKRAKFEVIVNMSKWLWKHCIHLFSHSLKK